MSVKGATKLHFTHYSCVVIILFHTSLYKSAFSTDSFGKLVFCIFALFALCGIRCDLHKLYNICTIIAYIVGDMYSAFLFSLISKKRSASQTFEFKHIWRKFQIINMPRSFWDIKILKTELIKKNVKHSQTERVKRDMNK